MTRAKKPTKVELAVMAERARVYRILRAEWEYWAAAVLTDERGLCILTGPAAEMFDAGTIVGTGAISNMLPAILSGESGSSYRKQVKRRATSARAGARNLNLKRVTQRKRKGAGDS